MTLPRKPARYWGDGDFNALADAIEGVSDSMPITYNQNDPPVPPIPANSVWIDTNDGGRAYVWSGTDWVSLEGPAGPQGPIGNDGATGSQGPAGPGSYTHIAYANAADGSSGFSTTDSTNKLYVGMYVDSISEDSTNPALYNWTLIKGADGSQGIPGPQGPNGQTPYLHIAYANSADGTVDFSTSVPDGRAYIGTMTNFVAEDPASPGFYTWQLVKGADGSDGASGDPGARGAGFFHLSNGGASAPATAQAFADLADDVVPQPNVFQDRVTIFNNSATPPWSVTKFWDGDSWEPLTQYLDGNLLVSGTVAASKIVAGSFVAVGGAAGDVNSGSTTISGGKITTGTLSADKIDANGLSANIITAGTLNVDRINAGSLNGTKLADATLGAGKFKCSMGTLVIGGGGSTYNVYGTGWSGAARVQSGAIWIVRLTYATARGDADSAVFVQGIGATGGAAYYLPKVTNRDQTTTDVGFVDPATAAFVDPASVGGSWSVFSLDG
jgi:hypothetical protein